MKTHEDRIFQGKFRIEHKCIWVFHLTLSHIPKDRDSRRLRSWADTPPSSLFQLQLRCCMFLQSFQLPIGKCCHLWHIPESKSNSIWFCQQLDKTESINESLYYKFHYIKYLLEFRLRNKIQIPLCRHR